MVWQLARVVCFQSTRQYCTSRGGERREPTQNLLMTSSSKRCGRNAGRGRQTRWNRNPSRHFFAIWHSLRQSLFPQLCRRSRGLHGHLHSFFYDSQSYFALNRVRLGGYLSAAINTVQNYRFDSVRERAKVAHYDSRPAPCPTAALSCCRQAGRHITCTWTRRSVSSQAGQRRAGARPRVLSECT